MRKTVAGTGTKLKKGFLEPIFLGLTKTVRKAM